jgi:hypothetical protein
MINDLSNKLTVLVETNFIFVLPMIIVALVLLIKNWHFLRPMIRLCTLSIYWFAIYYFLVEFMRFEIDVFFVCTLILAPFHLFELYKRFQEAIALKYVDRFVSLSNQIEPAQLTKLVDTFGFGPDLHNRMVRKKFDLFVTSFKLSS